MPYRYVSPQRVGFLRRFGVKTVTDFIWSGIGYGLQGNYGNVRTYLLFQFQMSKKEREIRDFDVDFKKINPFCCCSNLSNDDRQD